MENTRAKVNQGFVITTPSPRAGGLSATVLQINSSGAKYEHSQPVTLNAAQRVVGLVFFCLKDVSGKMFEFHRVGACR